MSHAKKYFANILLLYSPLILKLLKRCPTWAWRSNDLPGSRDHLAKDPGKIMKPMPDGAARRPKKRRW